MMFYNQKKTICSDLDRGGNLLLIKFFFFLYEAKVRAKLRHVHIVMC